MRQSIFLSRKVRQFVFIAVISLQTLVAIHIANQLTYAHTHRDSRLVIMAEEDRMDIDGMHFLSKADKVIQNTNVSDSESINEVSKTSKPKFEVKKWTAVAFWSWGMYKTQIRCHLKEVLLLT